MTSKDSTHGLNKSNSVDQFRVQSAPDLSGSLHDVNTCSIESVQSVPWSVHRSQVEDRFGLSFASLSFVR